jgi:hypothetical protein
MLVIGKSQQQSSGRAGSSDVSRTAHTCTMPSVHSMVLGEGVAIDRLRSL